MSNDQLVEIQESAPEATETVDYGPNPPRAIRDQLKALSKEIFGTENKYRKLYEGKELITRKTVETVPGENGEPDTTKTVDVPVLMNGTKQYRMIYRTTNEVMALLKEFKVKREEFLVQLKAQQEADKKAKEEAEIAKKVQDSLAGSALT